MCFANRKPRIEIVASNLVEGGNAGDYVLAMPYT